MESDSPSPLVVIIGRIVGAVAFLAVLLAPRPEGMAPEAHRLSAVTALMIALWLTNAIPMAVTSLIPLALYPLLGIQTAQVVSTNYLDPNVFLYFGGFVIALGVERWGLHRRVALHIVRWIGPGSRKIVLGFMLATGFLSMWISNTAATLLMLPIGLAMLIALREAMHLYKSPASEASETRPRDGEVALARMGTALVLGIAYAASIGGLGTPLGTPTNLVALGIWRGRPELVERYGTISMGNWMACCVPLTLVMLIATWGVLTWRVPPLPRQENLGRRFFTDRVRELGPMSRAEWIMAIVFVLTALLWIFRLPLRLEGWGGLPGWGPYAQRFLVETLHADKVFADPDAIHDSTVALFMTLILFLLPARRDDEGQTVWMMDWPTVQFGVPWGVLLLFGGGLAMANAFKTTGFSQWLGTALIERAEGLSAFWLVALVCFSIAFLTELTSNVATISALAPILIDAALGLNIDPRLLLIPATISASFGFALPVGTPPNAIAYGTGKVPLNQMLRHGLLLDLIGAVLTTLATVTLIAPVLGIAM